MIIHMHHLINKYDISCTLIVIFGDQDIMDICHVNWRLHMNQSNMIIGKDSVPLPLCSYVYWMMTFMCWIWNTHTHSLDVNYDIEWCLVDFAIVDDALW